MEIHGIRSYSQKELSKMDGRHPLTVKNSYKYIPIIFENGQTRANYKIGNQSSPYTVKYIRLDDLKDYMIDKYNIKITIEK